MKLLSLIWIQCKLNCKDKVTLINLVVYPILMTLALNVLFQVDPSTPLTIAVINDDQGELAKQMLEQLATPVVFVQNEEEGLIKVHEGRVAAILEIPQDFTLSLASGHLPTLILQKKAVQSLDLFERQVALFLQDQAKKSLFSQYNMTDQSQLIELDYLVVADYHKEMIPIIMLLAYTIVNSGRIAQQLRKLKTDHVLKRLMITNHDSFTIMSSLCLSYLLSQLVLLSLSVFIFLLLKFDIGRLSHLAVVLVLTSLVMMGFSIVMARTFKNLALIEWMTLIQVFILMGLGVMVMDGSVAESVGFFRGLAPFTPFYWLLDIVYHEKFFPAVWIVMLMFLVLLTAGSLKRSHFLQDQKGTE